MQPIFNQYEKDVRAKIKQAVEAYDLSFRPYDVNVSFDLKGRVAGYAGRDAAGRMFLRFNGEAVVKYNEDMTVNTIPHEVAHLVCFDRPQLGDGHDEGWKRVCRALGGDDSRCHDYVLTPAKIKPINRYTYILASGEEILVGPKYHNRLQRGETPYLMSRRTGEKVLSHHWTGLKKNLRPVAVPAPQQPGQPLPVNASKKQQAGVIYHANTHLPRGQVIALFVSQVGLTVAGASTYYQNFKSGKY